MIWERDHFVRRIYLTDRHSENVKPSWFGESIGHYEGGDSLVVDTIGLAGGKNHYIDSFRTPHTDKLHVVERFKMMDAGKTLQVLITVDDPGAFTIPWSAIQRFSRIDNRGALVEEPCAENNFNYFGYDVVPLPHADKSDF